ncbi:MAG: host attachment protein [Rhodospirillaceae bacterium]|nr:host attachment protein [Rhodospirillaceae bacterium]
MPSVSTAKSAKRQTRTARAKDVVEGVGRRHQFPLTWLLVADGAEAQIYAVEPVTFALTPLKQGRFKHRDIASRNLVSDRPGRSFNSRGSVRHALEPRVSPHQAAEDRFLKTVGQSLGPLMRAAKVGDLLIAAPPKAMAVLRKAMSKPVRDKIALEVTREWTKLAPLEITKRLIKALVRAPRAE